MLICIMFFISGMLVYIRMPFLDVYREPLGDIHLHRLIYNQAYGNLGRNGTVGRQNVIHKLDGKI